MSFPSQCNDDGPKGIHPYDRRTPGKLPVFVRIKEMLKAKRLWHVVRAYDAASSSSSRQGWASDTGSNIGSDIEYARNVAYSIILQALGNVPFACVMRFQEDPSQMWKFLNDRYSATTTVSKATMHTTLAQMKYTGQLMHIYIAK